MNQQLLNERLNQYNPESLINWDSLTIKDGIERQMVFEDEKNIDMAKTNFLNVLNNDEVKRTSENIIRQYGVGTCGPPAFLGTTDLHLEAEKKIAEFLCTEVAVVYAYGFIAISSSIAAYCNGNDIVFLDKKVNIPIQQGLIATKSKVVYYEHNDPRSLLEEVKNIAEIEKKQKRQFRKFLIIEGISWKTGKICPVLDFIKVAEQFKMRILLEETFSLGVLGKTGRGITEHFHVDPTRIDVIFGTFEGAVGAIGGFCAGSNDIVVHQQINGSGYVFSASLPTYLIKAIVTSINMIGDSPEKLVALAKDFHCFLTDVCKYKVDSDPECPFKVFSVDIEDEEYRNQKERQVHQYCEKNGIHFIMNENGLLINLNVALYEDEVRLQNVYDVLREASKLN